MSEVKLTVDKTEPTKQKDAEMNWRRIVGGIGIFGLFAALFISAGAKGAAGEFPKYMALASVLLILTSIVGTICGKLFSRPDPQKGSAD